MPPVVIVSRVTTTRSPAVVVLIEHGGPGGKVAGPVVKQILEGWWTKVRGGVVPETGGAR